MCIILLPDLLYCIPIITKQLHKVIPLSLPHYQFHSYWELAFHFPGGNWIEIVRSIYPHL